MASQSMLGSAAATADSMASKNPDVDHMIEALDDGTWGGWIRKQLALVMVYAANNPATFIYYVLIVLSPLLIVSAFCAYKLAKEIELRNKDQKRKQRRDANIKKSRVKKDN